MICNDSRIRFLYGRYFEGQSQYQGNSRYRRKDFCVCIECRERNGEDVTSDYATVFKKDLSDLAIADPAAEAAKKGIADKDEHYRTKIAAVDADAYNQRLFGQKEILRQNLNIL